MPKTPPSIRSHPSSDELARYVEGSSTQAERDVVESHLRSACIPCMFAIRERLEEPSSSTSLTSDAGPVVTGGMIDVVRRAERKALLVEAETAVAPDLIAELMLRPSSGRRETVRGGRRYKLLGLSEALREESRKEARRDVARALELSELAAEVSDCLSTSFYGGRIVADARALAWAMVGNSQRVAGDFFSAERAFQTASDLLERGSGNPTELAEMRNLLASLRIEQARFSEAIRLLTENATTYRQLALPQLEGKAVFKMGRAAILAGEPERAVNLFETALDLLDANDDAHLILLARHNVAFSLQDAGFGEEAYDYLQEISPAYDQFPDDRTLQIQRIWLEGLILSAIGDKDGAIERLSSIRRLSIEEERAYDTAQVTLDLAGILLATGATTEVKRLVREMYPVFRSQDVHRQAIAALVLFEQAVSTEAATVALARDVGRYLARARNNPYLKFEPSGSQAD